MVYDESIWTEKSMQTLKKDKGLRLTQYHMPLQAYLKKNVEIPSNKVLV